MSERQQWVKLFTSIRSTSQAFLCLMVWGWTFGFKGSPGLWYRSSCSPPWDSTVILVSLHNFLRLSCHTSPKGSLPHAVESYAILSTLSPVLLQGKQLRLYLGLVYRSVEMNKWWRGPEKWFKNPTSLILSLHRINSWKSIDTKKEIRQRSLPPPIPTHTPWGKQKSYDRQSPACEQGWMPALAEDYFTYNGLWGGRIHLNDRTWFRIFTSRHCFCLWLGYFTSLGLGDLTHEKGIIINTLVDMSVIFL